MRLFMFSVAWIIKLPSRNSLMSRRKMLSNNGQPHAVVELRNATIKDLDLVMVWDEKPHIQASAGDNDFNDWNWEYELHRNPSWRHQLVATANGVPIGFVQIIDPKEEESHYWGDDCEANLRAIDIWIGEEDYLGQGYGTRMMELALEMCFECAEVTGVLIDPMYDNTNAHRFYQRIGFEPVGERYFGPDRCLVHRLNRTKYERDGR